jgi:hypothetical protein
MMARVTVAWACLCTAHVTSIKTQLMMLVRVGRDDPGCRRLEGVGVLRQLPRQSSKAPLLQLRGLEHFETIEQHTFEGTYVGA